MKAWIVNIIFGRTQQKLEGPPPHLMIFSLRPFNPGLRKIYFVLTSLLTQNKYGVFFSWTLYHQIYHLLYLH